MSGQTSSNDDRRRRIRASAAWAAFGDALGFISELTDRRGVERRAGSRNLTTTVAWRRRIGGQFGPTIELPAGTVSDDTQLRLATSRSIRPSGAFDVETFSAIEMTVWPSYALGAGRGSLAAAAALRKRDVTWATNFFAEKGVRYLDGGGNGAAMRVQPHVWAHDRLSSDWGWLGDVLVNAIVTHGHARGFVGAAFHAACVDFALLNKAAPDPADWLRIIRKLERVSEVAETDDRLNEIWRRQWERASEQSIASAVQRVLGELRSDAQRCSDLKPGARGSYVDAVESLKAFEPAQRGSGTKTALLAVVAAYLSADRGEDGLVATADFVGTDTDSIATMQGAIIGAAGLVDDVPQHSVQDLAYIVREADRTCDVSEGARTARFPYPDLLAWRAPRSATDALGSAANEPHMAGLGSGRLITESYETHGRSPARWQWVELWFGQTVLAKRRPRPTALVASQTVRPLVAYVQDELLVPDAPEAPTQGARSRVSSARPERHQVFVREQHTLLDVPEERRRTDDLRPQRLSGDLPLDVITDRVIQGGLSDEAIGAGLRQLAHRPNAIEEGIAYSAIVLKALRARERRSRSP